MNEMVNFTYNNLSLKFDNKPIKRLFLHLVWGKINAG